MEIENRKSSNVAKAGLTTGIIGTALGAANWLGNGLGVNSCNDHCCNEDHCVDRYTLDMQMKIAKLESEKSFLESENSTNKKGVTLYKALHDEIEGLKANLNAQAVVNQKTVDSFQLVSERIDHMGRDFDCRLVQETRDRKCADNTIITYTNATFVPNQIAEYDVSKVTRLAPTYNPLPAECCG